MWRVLQGERSGWPRKPCAGPAVEKVRPGEPHRPSVDEFRVWRGGEAVVHLADLPLLRAVHASGEEVPSHVSELERLGLAFTGAASPFFEPTRQQVKAACAAEGILSPAWTAISWLLLLGQPAPPGQLAFVSGPRQPISSRHWPSRP